MKGKRQDAILKLIAEYPVETQEELIARLEAEGFHCTQSTVSRDIRQLHLVKELSGGVYRYTEPKKMSAPSDRLELILHECCTSCDSAQNLVVLKTMPGLANGAGAAIDARGGADVVGCVCGNDTVLIVTRSDAAARRLSHEINLICK